LNLVTASGTGISTGHHGELLQGAFDLGDGCPPWPALVTLPCQLFGSRAVYHRTQEPLTVVPEWKVKARSAAILTLDRFGLPPTGVLEITSSVPVSRGLGSSTNDVVAAIRAVAATLGRGIPPTACARLAVAAERASDPLMFGDAPILFAHRHGRVLAELGAGLPAFDVVSVDITPLRGLVRTDEQPLPSYDAAQVAAFGRLLARLRAALRDGDVPALAAVATHSGRTNATTYGWDCSGIDALAQTCGALGWQVAHSGSVAGLIFPPGSPWTARAAAVAVHVGFPGADVFQVGYAADREAEVSR
jgi:uncharacterized protein involved in propanediol utilization